MSAVCRFAPQNRTQQLRNFFFVMSFWPPWPGFSVKSDEPQFEPSLTPVANRWVGGAEPERNRSVVLPLAEARTICARRTTLCGAECERLIRSNSSPSLSLMQRPQCSTENRLAVLQEPQPHRAMFNHLKQMRCITTRYDKTALSFMSFLNLDAVRLWVRSFVNVT